MSAEGTSRTPYLPRGKCTSLRSNRRGHAAPCRLGRAARPVSGVLDPNHLPRQHSHLSPERDRLCSLTVIVGMEDRFVSRTESSCGTKTVAVAESHGSP